jgi:hypothetical protein
MTSRQASCGRYTTLRTESQRRCYTPVATGCSIRRSDVREPSQLRQTRPDAKPGRAAFDEMSAAPHKLSLVRWGGARTSRLCLLWANSGAAQISYLLPAPLIHLDAAKLGDWRSGASFLLLSTAFPKDRHR